MSDPLTPQHLGAFQSEEKTAYDVKWMPDAMTAIVGKLSQPEATPPTGTPSKDTDTA